MTDLNAIDEARRIIRELKSRVSKMMNDLADVEGLLLELKEDAEEA